METTINILRVYETLVLSVLSATTGPLKIFIILMWPEVTMSLTLLKQGEIQGIYKIVGHKTESSCMTFSRPPAETPLASECPGGHPAAVLEGLAFSFWPFFPLLPAELFSHQHLDKTYNYSINTETNWRFYIDRTHCRVFSGFLNLPEIQVRLAALLD